MLQEICLRKRWAFPIFTDIENRSLNRRPVTKVSCTILTHYEVGTGENQKFAKREAAIKMLHRLIRIRWKQPGNKEPLPVYEISDSPDEVDAHELKLFISSDAETLTSQTSGSSEDESTTESEINEERLTVSVPEKKSPDAAAAEQLMTKEPEVERQSPETLRSIEARKTQHFKEATLNPVIANRKKTPSVPEKKQPPRSCKKKAGDGKSEKKGVSKEGPARKERGRPKCASRGVYFKIQKRKYMDFIFSPEKKPNFQNFWATR
jgi:hypothetical protein